MFVFPCEAIYRDMVCPGSFLGCLDDLGVSAFPVPTAKFAYATRCALVIWSWQIYFVEAARKADERVVRMPL